MLRCYRAGACTPETYAVGLAQTGWQVAQAIRVMSASIIGASSRFGGRGWLHRAELRTHSHLGQHPDVLSNDRACLLKSC